MRRWIVLVAGIVLVAALALAIVPVLARGPGPRTLEEQVEWIADRWTAWLLDDCGEALALETLAGPRKELVEGLRARFDAPLTSQEFARVSGCMMGSVDGYRPDWLPLELELRKGVRLNLFMLDHYLAQPVVDEHKARLGGARVVDEVRKQVAEVFYLVQEELLAELLPLAEDPDTMRPAILAGVLMGGPQHVLYVISDPTKPMFKRPFTPEEMADLRATAKWAAQQARPRLESMLPVPTEVEFDTVAYLAAYEVTRAMWQVFWDEWPPMLSADEQRRLDEAMAERGRTSEPTISSESLLEESERRLDEAIAERGL